MEKKLANIEQQVQLWAILGPFVILMSFMLAFYKISTQHYYLALIPILSIPICLRSRFWGLLLSSVLVALLVVFSFNTLPVSDRYWLLGMSMAISLGMLVTALSLEEVRSVLGALSKESKSRLDNLLRLDEKLTGSREDWQRKQRAYEADLQRLRGELKEQARTLDLYTKLVPQMQCELNTMEGGRTALLRELEQNRSQRAQLDSQLRDAQAEIAGLTDAYSMSQDEREKACHRRIAELEAALANADQEFIDLHGRLDLSENAGVEARAHVEKLEHYLTKLRQERKQMEQQLQLSQRNLESLQREQNESQQLQGNLEKQCEALRESVARADQELQTVRETCTQLQRERELLQEQAQKEPVMQPVEQNVEQFEEENLSLQRMLKRWEAMYKQLRTQFEEKGRVLGDTRAQLFHTENQLLRLQREMQEEQELSVSEVEASLEEYLQGMEVDLREAEREQAWSEQAYSDLISSLLEELNTYKSQKQAAMV